MKKAATPIGRYVMVPYHIVIAPITPRAREVWILIASNGSPEKPEVWVRQPALAEKLRCSTDVIGRAIQELKRARLLFETGRLQQGRHKIYHVNWLPVDDALMVTPAAELRNDVPHFCGTIHRADAVLSSAISPVDTPQICGNLNRVLTQQEKNNSSDLDSLLTSHGESWAQTFACLDGRSGRPSIRETVEQALNHTAVHKCKSVKIYAETWLRNASLKWLSLYNRELSAPASDPSLSKDAVARKLAESDASRKRYEQQRRENLPRIEPRAPSPVDNEVPLNHAVAESDEERAWIITRIKATLEKERKQAELEARDKARFLSRGVVVQTPSRIDTSPEAPICRENHRIMWDFLRIQWANGRLKMAA